MPAVVVGFYGTKHHMNEHMVLVDHTGQKGVFVVQGDSVNSDLERCYKATGVHADGIYDSLIYVRSRFPSIGYLFVQPCTSTIGPIHGADGISGAH